MATVTEAVAAFRVENDAFMTRLETGIDGVKGDIKFVKDKLEAIDNGPGQISDADQALLTAALARLGLATEKVEVLDSETPPVPPVV